MAGAFKTWLSNMAKIIKVKTGKLPSEKIKPFDYPDLIASISGGAGNAVADMGRCVISSADITNGVATIKHNLGIKPDYILLFALDSPKVSNDKPYHFMGTALPSKALSDRMKATNPNIKDTGFIYGRSLSQGDPDRDYFYSAQANLDAYYEGVISAYPGFLGGLYSVTASEISFGVENAPIVANREFFYALIGNLF